MIDLLDLRNAIKTEADRLGFNHIGIAPALPVPHIQAYLEWVTAGRHGRMDYLAREDTLAKRADPRLILEGCQRVICLAMPYMRPQTDLESVPPGQGRISNYAATQDYHQVIWAKLSQLEAFIQANTPEEAQIKSYVDTGPILERSYAAAAGIGIAGKNSCLLIQGTGSYFFLAEILTDLELPVDKPFTRDLCGTCRRCIDACPTGCIRDDHTIDARRCISYLTIENKAEIPDNLKGQVGRSPITSRGRSVIGSLVVTFAKSSAPITLGRRNKTWSWEKGYCRNTLTCWDYFPSMKNPLQPNSARPRFPAPNGVGSCGTQPSSWATSVSIKHCLFCNKPLKEKKIPLSRMPVGGQSNPLRLLNKSAQFSD